MQYDIYKYRLSILNLELTNAFSEIIVQNNNNDLFAAVDKPWHDKSCIEFASLCTDKIIIYYYKKSVVLVPT